MDNTRLKSKADIKPSTLNPGTIASTIKITKAFKTNVNKPSVIMFTGKVSMMRIGFINVLTTASTTYTTIAVKKSLIATPGIIRPVTKTATPLIIKLISVCISFFSHLLFNISSFKKEKG